MSNNIVEEENPNQPQAAGAGGAQDKIRKQARQLAYDVRYKVKGQFKDGQKTDPASLKRAYMSQLGKSPASGPVRQLAKKMLVGESYDFIDLKETASSAVADAIKKVFVKTIELDDADGNPAYEITDLAVKEEVQEKKYKVRVTDKKTGKSYTRMADRAKISELRKNPNISSVEMTGYGTPYEGEKKKGSQTAAVKSGKGLAKKDYDGDGKRESSSKEHAGSVHNAIQRKKGGIADGKDTRKEEFIGEVVDKNNGSSSEKKVDVMKGKNKITINPTQAEAVDPGVENKKSDDGMDAKQKRVAIMKRQILQRKMQAVRGGAGADIVAHTELEGEVIEEGSVKQARGNVGASKCWDGYKAKGTKMKGGRPVPNCVKEEEESGEKKLPKNTIEFDGGATIEPVGDSREIPTLLNLVKNKLRARGLNMSFEPKGEVVSEKKADKDYDGDGKIESGKDEYFGSKDKAIKKAMGKKHNCASKVKHEEYGLGDCIKGMHDLDESGEVAHYDVLFEHGVEKNVDVSSLEILEYSMHEHAIVDGYAVVEAKMEEGIEDIIARLEKKRISKGGDPDKSPLGKKTGQAMKAKQDAARKKAGVKTEGYQRDPERQEKERKTSKQTDPSKDNFTGISGSIATIMKQNAAMKKAAAKKVKKEELDPMVQSAVDALNRYSSKKQ
tara:strand:+ start:516 stop:2522 length:2007 start_codon:yes stop_codon:yes gene_type:complete